MKSANKIIPVIAAVAFSTPAFAGNNDGGYASPQQEVQQEIKIRDLEKAMQRLHETGTLEVDANGQLRIKRDVFKELSARGILKTETFMDHIVCN